jgi:hypothetical protein
MRRWLAPLAGIAIGLLIALVVVRFLPRAKDDGGAAAEKKDPPALAGALLPEDRGALDVVLFQYTPRLEPIVARPYADFLGTLDPSTKLIAVIPEQPDAGTGGEPPARPALHALLTRIDPTGALEARTTVVESKGPISIWSKDRALVMQGASPGDRTGLLIPMPPDPKWTERANDWRTLASVASQNDGRYYVRELPLYFDAGDFAVTGDDVLVDVNLFTRNASRGVGSPAALKELLGKLFTHNVVLLGDADGDVPRHHMSMYMTPVGDRTVLVGDPRLAQPIVGATYVPGEASVDTGVPLRADFSDAVLARYDRAAALLEKAGYRVVRIPTVAFDDKTYFAYTNGVYETRGTRKIAWVPQYAKDDSDGAVRALDDAARKAYEDLGWEVRPVHVRAAYPYHGTIGCLANVLSRTLVNP